MCFHTVRYFQKTLLTGPNFFRERPTLKLNLYWSWFNKKCKFQTTASAYAKIIYMYLFRDMGLLLCAWKTLKVYAWRRFLTKNENMLWEMDIETIFVNFYLDCVCVKHNRVKFRVKNIYYSHIPCLHYIQHQLPRSSWFFFWTMKNHYIHKYTYIVLIHIQNWKERF